MEQRTMDAKQQVREILKRYRAGYTDGAAYAATQGGAS